MSDHANGGTVLGGTIWVGTRKGLFAIDDRPDTPEIAGSAFLGVPVSACAVDPRDGAVYAGLDHGHFGVKLHRSDDAGTSWVELAAPAYPEKPADLVDVNPMTQTPRVWATQLLWELVPGHDADVPGSLWCGTIPGGLFRSTDRGATWQLVRSLWDDPSRTEWFGGGYDEPGLHSVVLDPRSPDQLLVGISCGGAWRTDDRGGSWRVSSHGMAADFMPPDRSDDPTIQDPHRIVRCAAEPDVLWTQHHCGIWRTADNAGSWQEVVADAPSRFGFAVAVHPNRPDTAWFVPAVRDEQRIPVDGKFVVTRTRDGGRTFDVLDTGLPTGPAYHLVYRHGLAVDATGERLVVASTTGSVWVSHDGGEHFRLVTADLPPVLCVGFVP